MASITINTGKSYQTFTGWQATAQAAHQYDAITDAYEYPSSTFANYDTEILDAMLDLGINSLRLEINVADVNATGYADSPNNAAIQPSTAAAGDWYFDRIDTAIECLVEPYRTLLAAQGETLEVVLCVVDFRATGYQLELTPSEYAFFVNYTVDHIWTTYGFRPDYIEAILEPDGGTNSGEWTAARCADNIVSAAAELDSNGHTGIGWIAPSTTNGPGCLGFYQSMKSANASLEALIDVVAYHRYVDFSGQLGTLTAEAEGDGKTTAMLELIAATHLTLYSDLIDGHNSMWQQYTITFPYTGGGGDTDDGSQYFLVNKSTWAVTPANRTKYLRHYMKYIRSGAVMKGVTNESSSYQGVPFQNANGTYVVPIKCTTNGSIVVSGLPAGTYGIRYTTGDGSSAPSAYDQALSNQTIGMGEDVSFTMPAAGVVTVFDVNYNATPSPTATTTIDGAALSGGVKLN